MKKSLITTFWATVGVFLLIVSEFFIPWVRELFKGSLVFLLPFMVFFLLGVLLIILTLKEKIVGRLKKFLILTGASAAGFFVFVFLHNAFYGLAMLTGQIAVLKYLVEALQVACFLIAIFVCPLGFLVGAVGSAKLLIKKRQ